MLLFLPQVGAAFPQNKKKKTIPPSPFSVAIFFSGRFFQKVESFFFILCPAFRDHPHIPDRRPVLPVNIDSDQIELLRDYDKRSIS